MKEGAAGYLARSARTIHPSDCSAEHTSRRTVNEKVLYVVTLAEADGGLVSYGMLLLWSEDSDGQCAGEIL